MKTEQVIQLKSTEFAPRKDSILVKYDKPEQEVKTESGIVVQMHRSSLERQTYGEVVAVGTDVDWISEGEFVIWAMTDGINLELEDGEFLVLRETSILGKRK